MNSLLLCLLVGGTPGQGNALTPTEAIIDKADARGGPPLTQAFEFKHTAGAGLVVVTGVEAACGCHRHAITNRVLNPGDKTTLTLEVNTLTQPAGKNAWTVRVKYQHEPPSGAPVPGHVDVTLKANLTHEVSVFPAQLVISASGETTHTLTVTDHRSIGKLSVLKVSTSSAYLSAEAKAVQTQVGKRTQDVELKLLSSAPAGQSEETIVLYTDDTAYPELRVPVRLIKKLPGSVVANPEKATIRLAMQAKASSLVQIRSADGKMVAIDKAECTHPAVVLKYSPEAGPVATVRITVDSTKGKTGKTEVIVTLKEPKGQTVTVPVTWAD